jgi:hypothetical protein
MRTVTTPQARAAARGLRDELPGLDAAAADLSRHGGTLADPRIWDGPKARVFRTQVWPDMEAALRALRTSLDGLARAVGDVHQRITDAGS